MARYRRADELGLNTEQKEAFRYHEKVQGGHMTNMFGCFCADKRLRSSIYRRSGKKLLNTISRNSSIR